jgi:hypothetical protein
VGERTPTFYVPRPGPLVKLYGGLGASIARCTQGDNAIHQVRARRTVARMSMNASFGDFGHLANYGAVQLLVRDGRASRSTLWIDCSLTHLDFLARNPEPIS